MNQNILSYFTDMPVVTLKMGSSLNPDDIKEGADVYFECLIQSNPKPYKMSWYHNVSFSTINDEKKKRAFDDCQFDASHGDFSRHFPVLVNEFCWN